MKLVLAILAFSLSSLILAQEASEPIAPLLKPGKYDLQRTVPSKTSNPLDLVFTIKAVENGKLTGSLGLNRMFKQRGCDGDDPVSGSLASPDSSTLLVATTENATKGCKRDLSLERKGEKVMGRVKSEGGLNYSFVLVAQ